MAPSRGIASFALFLGILIVSCEVKGPRKKFRPKAWSRLHRGRAFRCLRGGKEEVMSKDITTMDMNGNQHSESMDDSTDSSVQRRLWRAPAKVAPGVLGKLDDDRPVCRQWLNGLCEMGKQCDKLHQFVLEKMPYCIRERPGKICPLLDDCPFRHRNDALGMQDQNQRNDHLNGGGGGKDRRVRIPCLLHLFTSFCPFRSICKYHHPVFNAPPPTPEMFTRWWRSGRLPPVYLKYLYRLYEASEENPIYTDGLAMYGELGREWFDAGGYNPDGTWFNMSDGKANGSSVSPYKLVESVPDAEATVSKRAETLDQESKVSEMPLDIAIEDEVRRLSYFDVTLDFSLFPLFCVRVIQNVLDAYMYFR
ncbi:hypothetical protein AAMO2058_000658000 [Amorphochlora amoebiformis]